MQVDSETVGSNLHVGGRQVDIETVASFTGRR